MAGYNGYSMSNNAVSAYRAGEKPYSKWTKATIIEEIEKAVAAEELPAEILDDINGMKAADLKAFLKYSSWHHTSARYNRTAFYALDIESLLSRFGYRLAVQVTTPDGVKVGNWSDKKPDGFGYYTFCASDGTRYPIESTTDRKVVYVKR